MNLILPCAGLGSRFKEKGYDLPKPLIDVFGKPMIERVYNCFDRNLFKKVIFLCLESHEKDYNISSVIKGFCPDAIIVFILEKTEGALCTALLAAPLWDNDEPLTIANSDQLITLDRYTDFNRNSLSTFFCWDRNSKWSYCETNYNKVLKVVEKEAISECANTGIYHFSSAAIFRKYANIMIEQNLRSKGEFYIAPIYNLLIADEIPVYHNVCEYFVGLGTPEDLEKFKNDKQ